MPLFGKILENKCNLRIWIVLNNPLLLFPPAQKTVSPLENTNKSFFRKVWHAADLGSVTRCRNTKCQESLGGG